MGFPGGSAGEEPACYAGDPRFLGQEDPPGKGMSTHSSILAWRIPWTEQPGRLQSMGSQGVRHHCTTNHSPEPITAQALERQVTSSLGMSSVKGSPGDVKTRTRKGAAKRVVAVARGRRVPDAGENSTVFAPQGG